MTRIWVESEQIDEGKVGIDSGRNKYHTNDLETLILSPDRSDNIVNNDLEILLDSPDRSDNMRAEISSTTSRIKRCNNWVYVFMLVLTVSVSIATIVVLLRQGNSSRLPKNIIDGRVPEVPTLMPSSSGEIPSFIPTTLESKEPSVLDFLYILPTEYPTNVPFSGETENPSLPFSGEPTAADSAPFSLDFDLVLEDSVLVLKARERLFTGDFVKSSSGIYSAGVDESGAVVVLKARRNNKIEIVWKSHDSGNKNVTCFLQPDGNLVLRHQDDNSIAWATNTSGYPGTSMQLDNRGQLSLVSALTKTKLWIAGMPRNVYQGSPDDDMTFPIRGVFYEIWFPESWKTNGNPVKFDPSLGKYKFGEGNIEYFHVDSLEYMHADLVIASWFGPDKHSDRARLTNMMDRSRGKNLKWTIYHQHEKHHFPSVDEITLHLEYIKTWFAWHDTWAHIDGKPVIFVNNEQTCEAAERWMTASQKKWYVVLKLFPRENCDVQPDHWHLYDPTVPVHQTPGFSYAISPGYWKVDEATPRLSRVEQDEWRENVRKMKRSNEPWQLVTTFNDWGEGTATESADQWTSLTGHGRYLDALHEIP
mmetsp:Transcript_1301/g.1678  ORF Transcript_1301/g.1678 Transcript_1301/m.1678 type:complete len:589 (+) Transcript_1301:160-1926(+)